MSQLLCIAGNAMGAVNAVTAASLALEGDGAFIDPLDAAVEAHECAKETCLGGLAVKVVAGYQAKSSSGGIDGTFHQGP